MSKIVIYLTPKEHEIYNLIEPELNQKGYNIRMVQLTNTCNINTFQISIETQSGSPITHEDCIEVGNICTTTLKLESKSIPLEISSAGINPNLTRREDFEKHINCNVKVKLKIEVENQMNWTGEINDVNEEGIELKCLSKNVFIPYNLIRKTKKVENK